MGKDGIEGDDGFFTVLFQYSKYSSPGRAQNIQTMEYDGIDGDDGFFTVFFQFSKYSTPGPAWNLQTMGNYGINGDDRFVTVLFQFSKLFYYSFSCTNHHDHNFSLFDNK